MASVSLKRDADGRKHRAKLSREHHRATKAWDVEVRAAVAGSIWRVQSVWIEETSKTACAEFVNASNGKMLALKLVSSIGGADRRDEVQRVLSINT